MACPNPFVNEPDRLYNLYEWKQVAAAYDPSGGDNFSGEGGGETTIIGTKVPFNKLQSFYRYILGWQNCSQTAGVHGVTLQRTLPQRHPRYFELVADAVQGMPFKPDSTAYSASNLSGLKRYVSAPETIPTLPYFTGYQYAKATVGFRDVDYELVEDNDLDIYSQSYNVGSISVAYSFPSEWQRFTTFDPAPRVEALSLDGFTMVYAEGTGNTGNNTNPMGTSVPAPQGQLLVKADLALTTYRLPQEFLFPPQSFFPRNVLAALGKVNAFTLFNQAAGTLLYIGCEMTKRRFSLRVPTGYNGYTETRYLWKVKHLFSFFDPPKGYSNDNTAAPLNTYRGHNCIFYIGARNATNGAVSSGDINSMKWFYATGSGTATDPGLLPYFDHAQLWWPVCNTAGTLNPVYGTNYQYYNAP